MPLSLRQVHRLMFVGGDAAPSHPPVIRIFSNRHLKKHWQDNSVINSRSAGTTLPSMSALQPPEKPLPGDCCGNGCTPCVWDTYYDELKEYKELLEKQQEQQASAANDQGSITTGKDEDAHDAKPVISTAVAEGEKKKPAEDAANPSNSTVTADADVAMKGRETIVQQRTQC